jgi:hypothetical protein
LAAHFKSFRNIKQIAELLDTINAIQGDLRKMVFSDFEGGQVFILFGKYVSLRRFTQQGSCTGNLAALSEACLVIDVLDKDVKYVPFYYHHLLLHSS